jgi:hypothetical protein
VAVGTAKPHASQIEYGVLAMRRNEGILVSVILALLQPGVTWLALVDRGLGMVCRISETCPGLQGAGAGRPL